MSNKPFHDAEQSATERAAAQRAVELALLSTLWKRSLHRRSGDQAPEAPGPGIPIGAIAPVEREPLPTSVFPTEGGEARRARLLPFASTKRRC